MKLPASSNSSTGGAALSFWSFLTVVGRCRIHAWPRSSIETLDTSPHTYLLGSLGQDASTSNFGISRVGGSAGFSTRPTSNATADAASRIRMIVLIRSPPLDVFVDRGAERVSTLRRFHSLSSDDRARNARAQKTHKH